MAHFQKICSVLFTNLFRSPSSLSSSTSLASSFANFFSTSSTTKPSEPEVLLETRNHVRFITLNRPTKLNALTLEMFKEVGEALHQAATDDNVHLAVMTAVGEYYSAGNDLNNFTRILADCDGDLAAALEVGVTTPHTFACSFIDFPKPLVGVINGPAVGIAATTAALMDVLVAADTASFTTPFTAIGQTPESASSALFPRILGPSLANRMLLLNHQMTAHEALQRGFVGEVVVRERLEEHLEEMLFGERSLLKGAFPNAMASAKRLVRSEEVRAALRATSRRECELLRTVFAGEECQQALMRFFRRKG